MTPEEKDRAKADLHKQLSALKVKTFDHWLMLMEYNENMRKCCGYSKGPEAMIQQLTKDYRKAQAKLMKPFDRGDYD